MFTSHNYIILCSRILADFGVHLRTNTVDRSLLNPSRRSKNTTIKLIESQRQELHDVVYTLPKTRVIFLSDYTQFRHDDYIH